MLSFTIIEHFDVIENIFFRTLRCFINFGSTPIKLVEIVDASIKFLLRIDARVLPPKDMGGILAREMYFLKFQKFDSYFMAVKRVPLDSGWFRPALTRCRYMKLNAKNIKLANEPIFQ